MSIIHPRADLSPGPDIYPGMTWPPLLDATPGARGRGTIADGVRRSTITPAARRSTIAQTPRRSTITGS